MATAELTAWTAPCTLLSRREVGPDAIIMELALPEPMTDVAPGVFAMLSPADGSGPEIPRPFSLYDLPAPDRATFLVQIMGRGTQALAAVSPGQEVLCTMPLGNGFTLPAPERPVVIVAGGVGCAPFLHYLRLRLQQGAGARTHMIYGARESSRLYDYQAFAALDGIDLRAATDDGSLGFHGNVIAALDAGLANGSLPRDADFLACGPAGLLHGFADYARKQDLQAWLSLETYMGCGFGVCNACPVETEPEGPLGAWPWARTCREGPVFPLTSIRF
jgi:dihydroorotate dehydrogenase electron transfer subunit